jgi:hypothetical protein
MQNGRFDVADRLFSSIPMTFLHNTTQLSEVKELTPGNQVVNTKEDVYMTKLRCSLIYKKNTIVRNIVFLFLCPLLLYFFS